MASKFRSIRFPPKRLYHSYDHPPPPGPFPPIETAILRAASSHVPSHGFTNTSLALGAQDAGYLPASTNLFPRGAFSLAHWHLYTQRIKLATHTGIVNDDKVDGKGKVMGVGGKVKALTWERLMGNREVIHRWQEVCCSHLYTSLEFTQRAMLTGIYLGTSIDGPTIQYPHLNRRAGIALRRNMVPGRR